MTKKSRKPYHIPTKAEIDTAKEGTRLLREEIERVNRLVPQMMNMRFMAGCLIGRIGTGIDTSMF